MKIANKMLKAIFLFLLPFLLIILPGNANAQEKQVPNFNRDTLIAVARDYMETVRYCALITIDDSGQPNARTMDALFPDENMVVYLGTNRNSRKVKEIWNNPKVTLYYADKEGIGYVSIMGTARLIDDPEIKSVWWKEEWEQYYTDNKESYILIKVIPDKLEIVNYNHGIYSNSKTWEAPFVEFKIIQQKK